MKRGLRMICLLLVLVLLTGCQVPKLITGGKGTAYADMEYIRPDILQHDRQLRASCNTAKSSDDVDAVLQAVYDYYEVFDRFYASYNLAYLHYCANMTSSYWEEEYDFSAQYLSRVDAGLEELYYCLADSPIRGELEEAYFGDGFFDAYEGESVRDETFLSYMEQETALQERYYEIVTEASQAEYYSEDYFSRYGTQLAQIFVELIALRQKLADYVGYDSYPQFAYDWYHERDYTPALVETYLQKIGEEMAPLYASLAASDLWETGSKSCTEQEMFAYVCDSAKAMGGDIAKAFEHMQAYDLYDIKYSENKYETSFETYLLYYYEPFVYVCPYGANYDKLTFAHEFGHFVNDYVCNYSYAGTDVAEVHSQAMEYMSLLYGNDTGELKKLKMADSLCTYVEQAAYALFEQQVYDLSGEDLTVENVQKLYQQIGTQFGFDSWDFDGREYVDISHLFIQPMYLVSYVVSNDVAFQLYQMEEETPGKGLDTYQNCLYSQDSYLLTFVQTYGLQSPFAPGRVNAVRKTLEEILS